MDKMNTVTFLELALVALEQGVSAGWFQELCELEQASVARLKLVIMLCLGVVIAAA